MSIILDCFLLHGLANSYQVQSALGDHIRDTKHTLTEDQTKPDLGWVLLTIELSAGTVNPIPIAILNSNIDISIVTSYIY